MKKLDMNFRFAKNADAKEIATISITCAKHQKDGFMHLLGGYFMTQYYSAFIKEKHSVIIVAEKNGVICGFHSGTTLSEEHQSSISKNKIQFAIAVIPKILLKPKLLNEILRRYKSLKSDDNKYRVTKGPRAEYWAWLPSIKDPAGSIILRKTWSNIMYDLGCKSFKFEVDLSNSDVNRYAKAFSCDVLEINNLPDGRKRAIMEQVLKKRN